MERFSEPIQPSGNLSASHAASDGDYWHGLVDEKAAAQFLGLTDRTLQAMRQRGDGPSYVRLSSRCLRYRRIELRAWADARIRKSTADPGAEGACHASVGG